MDDRVTDIKERLANPSGGMNVDVVLIVLFVVDFVVVAAIVGSLAPRVAVWAAPLALAIPFGVFGLITVIAWKPLERRFPAAPQSRDAIVKLGQSLQLGAFARFNNAISMAADEDHLHLIPLTPMRLTGAKVVSVPWDRVTDIGPPPGRFSMKLTKATADGKTLAAPEWAMQFARVELPENEASAEPVSTAPTPSP
ncbi:MAG: hypothetical protein ACTS27_07140 [Phycisphaerales bacterium]